MSALANAKDVAPIDPEASRFRHVVKHLYNPQECWEQVVASLVGSRERAGGAGCTRPCLSRGRPDWDAASAPCRRHVLGDHDDDYAPAYLAAITEAETAGQLARLPPDGHGPPGVAYVDRQGVFVIVRQARNQKPRVTTAFRVRPATTAKPQVADFFRAAMMKLRDKSTVPRGKR